MGDRRVFERLPQGRVKPALALSLHTTKPALREQLLPRAPRITPADIEAEIDSEHYFTAAQGDGKAMEDAANELGKARDQQVSEWKKELTGEMDRSIQEMLQLAREQDNLEQQARQGKEPGELRSQQSALQQGDGGFGYDPLFFIPEFGKTAAELDPAIKNGVSHRAQALQSLLARLRR